MASIVIGKRYKVVNTVAQNAIHVVAGSSNGASVTTTPWKGVTNQVWKATEHTPNVYQFEIDNQPTPNVTFVLDASQTSLGEACVYESRASDNQLWTVEPIKPNAFLNFIVNKRDGRVLQYDDENKKARVVNKDVSSPNQYWTFEE